MLCSVFIVIKLCSEGGFELMGMLAVQVKYLGPTSIKGARLKVWSEGNRIIEHGRDYALGDAESQAKVVARAYAEQFGFGEPTGWGVLPNHDYVMTFGD